MYRLMVGVAQVSLYFRHAQTLKDKRNIIKSVTQRLKNQGCSVVETGHPDSPKQGSVGFAYVGSEPGFVQKVIDDGLKLFELETEVLSHNSEVFDFSGEDADAFDFDPGSDDKLGDPTT